MQSLTADSGTVSLVSNRLLQTVDHQKGVPPAVRAGWRRGGAWMTSGPRPLGSPRIPHDQSQNPPLSDPPPKSKLPPPESDPPKPPKSKLPPES